MSAIPKSTAPTTTRNGPSALIHTRAPEGCVAETTSTVLTVAGPVTIRVRRFLVQCYVGGRGYDLYPRVEVAVRTPKSTTDGRGFVPIPDADGMMRWATPADDLALHIAIGAALEEVAERRQAEDRAAVAPERGARRRPLARTPGEALHRACGVAGVGDHYAHASRVLGREVGSFNSLAADDIRRVRAALPIAEVAAR